MSVYVNRLLNLKKIKAIGLDMDYTLVRYHTEIFEDFVHKAVLQKLVEVKDYPDSILKMDFNFQKVIQGLVLDRRFGNLLKLSRFGKVKMAYHGTHKMDFSEQQKVYQQKVIDLQDVQIQSLDTNFSISNGVLFGQLVDKKDQGEISHSYEQMADDIKEMLDLAHRDGTLKNEVKNNISKYIIRDPELPPLLERYKSYDKKLLVITNSDFFYTKLLLDYTITPYLTSHKSWQELFDVVITFSMKPRFFTEKSLFLKIDPETGLMSNYEGQVDNGIFQGGNALKLEEDLGISGEDILYLGDHIYGDVVSIKKNCNWRTALVLEPLQEELASLKRAQKIARELDAMMAQKEIVEDKINNIHTLETKQKSEAGKKNLSALYQEVEDMNQAISDKIVAYQAAFNPFWGELMRAGLEESRFAGQTEKYACIYMQKITDLLKCSPRTYFRPAKRILPHERPFL